MATYASMVNDISPYLQGCPSLVIERTARKIVTDLCQRAKVWRGSADSITLVVDDYDYTPTFTSDTTAEFVDVLDAWVVIDDVKTDLVVYPYDVVRRLYPAWPQDSTGTPQVLTVQTPGAVQVAPVPDAAGTLNLVVSLRPTSSATTWPDGLYREFHRVVFHGVLAELLRMKDRTWTDVKESDRHGKIWTDLVASARDRADRGFMRTDLSAKMRPFA